MKPKLRWLVYAVLLTSLATTVTLSRYMATVAGNGTASVARVALSGGFGGGAANLELGGLKPGDQKQFTFEIVNYSGGQAAPQVSEVTQNYSIRLESTGNLPVTYSLEAGAVEAGQGTAATPWTGPWRPDGANPSAVTAANGTLPHSVASTHTYTLTARWPAEKNQAQYSHEVDAVTLYVESEQAAP